MWEVPEIQMWYSEFSVKNKKHHREIREERKKETLKVIENIILHSKSNRTNYAGI